MVCHRFVPLGKRPLDPPGEGENPETAPLDPVQEDTPHLVGIQSASENSGLDDVSDIGFYSILQVLSRQTGSQPRAQLYPFDYPRE